jgi:hypothetical protein
VLSQASVCFSVRGRLAEEREIPRRLLRRWRTNFQSPNLLISMGAREDLSCRCDSTGRLCADADCTQGNVSELSTESEIAKHIARVNGKLPCFIVFISPAPPSAISLPTRRLPFSRRRLLETASAWSSAGSKSFLCVDVKDVRQPHSQA